MYDIIIDIMFIAVLSILFIGLTTFLYFRSCLFKECAEFSQQIAFESTFSNSLADWDDKS